MRVLILPTLLPWLLDFCHLASWPLESVQPLWLLLPF